MFKFRLASIKKLKEYIEKQCKDEFARCLTNLYLAQEQQRRTEENIKFMEEEISGMQQGVLNLPNLIISQDYLSFLHEELVRQKQVVAEKKEELEIARSKLMEAMKNRKIMDKLEEKQYQQYI